jgi:integrase
VRPLHQNGAASGRENREPKERIANRIKEHWPGGSIVQVGKIKSSDVDMWLARYRFGVASRNFHIQVFKDVFNLALRDKMLSESPAAHLKYTKRAKPIRLTPTWEQFRMIVADVRSQQFNADAQDSGDFLEAMGLLGLGQAELAPLTRADIDLEAGRVITFRHKTSRGFAVRFFHRRGHCLNVCVKRRPAATAFSKSPMQKRRSGMHVSV